jgi:two-component system, sensor histidine kinase
MFEPFTQADGSTTRSQGGTGLGLAIVRGLIDLMGGTIGAHGAPGRGTTFWFELDLATPIADDTQPHSRPTSAGASRLGSAAPLVLVAEDSPLNQVVAVRALERCGCRTEVVGDGRAALQALSTQRYDAVLMDCHMPTIDGYQATALLRQRERQGEHTPVIAMGADRGRCRDAGMDDYLINTMRSRGRCGAGFQPSQTPPAAPRVPPTRVTPRRAERSTVGCWAGEPVPATTDTVAWRPATRAAAAPTPR